MKKITIIILLFSCGLLCSSIQAPTKPRPNSVKRYIQKYRYLSVGLHKETGIPIPIILAIAGLESNWGKSELATSANNHFGIKNKEEWGGNTYCKETIEYDGWWAFSSFECFRKYAYIKDSYIDFGQFIRTRPNYGHLKYAPNWNYRAWAEGLRAGGYATDPNYADKLLQIIWRYRLFEMEEF